jgi:hypothetical protein
MATSPEAGSNQFQQLLSRVGIQWAGELRVTNEVPQNVILGDFGHQSRYGAPRPGDQVHDLFACRFAVERALDRLDLAPDASHSGQQLPLLADRVCHTRHIA